MTEALIFAALYVGFGLGVTFWVSVVEDRRAGNWWKYPVLIFFWPVVLVHAWKESRR